jgi:hypothetical protein
VLTVTVFGIVGLTAVPVLAAIWTDAELTGPTTGRVGETLTYTVRVLQCEGEHLGESRYECILGRGYFVTISFRDNNGQIPIAYAYARGER